MSRLYAMATMILLNVATPAWSQALPQEEALPQSELASFRGGFQLPNGVAINLGVTTDTKVDGREVLRTVLEIGAGAPTLEIRANRNGDNGLSVIDAASGAVETADGIVRLQTAGRGSSVTLSGDRLEITHLIGPSLGSVVANSGNDRSIDVLTSVNVGLAGTSPEAIGGSMARIDSLSLDVTARLNP